MKFIDREKEITYLKDHLALEPNSMLFVYGPKSSGKSTLLLRVCEMLNPNEYSINFMDLRRVYISDYKSFQDTFFLRDAKNKLKDLAKGITLNAGFFKIPLDEEKLFSQNPFKVMQNRLEAARKKGITPVLIIDEIQLLKPIKTNSDDYLIDKLFNLFIGLTKVMHVAHVILATSDSYFIEDLYNSSKLANTSEFMLLDHFEKTVLNKWLIEEQFNPDEIENVWNTLGGCPWQIQQVINKRKMGTGVEQTCKQFVNDAYAKLDEFAYGLLPEEKKVFWLITQLIVEKGFCDKHEIEENVLFRILTKKLVALDHWFYHSDRGHVVANSQSVYLAMERLNKARNGK